MEARDKLYALGRGPPCFECGHVCHLSFAQLGVDRSHGNLNPNPNPNPNTNPNPTLTQNPNPSPNPN